MQDIVLKIGFQRVEAGVSVLVGWWKEISSYLKRPRASGPLYHCQFQHLHHHLQYWHYQQRRLSLQRNAYHEARWASTELALRMCELGKWPKKEKWIFFEENQDIVLYYIVSTLLDSLLMLYLTLPIVQRTFVYGFYNIVLFCCMAKYAISMISYVLSSIARLCS